MRAAEPPGVTFLAPVQFDTGDQLPSDVELADFNGDGYLDLAIVTTQGSGKDTTFLLGDGAGHLLKNDTLCTSPVTPNPTPVGWGCPTPYATGITSADFNGDGIRDFAVTQTSNKLAADGLCPGTQPGTLIYLGTGGAVPQFTFKGCVLATPAGFLNDATAGDFTGDGTLDLVVGDSSTRGLRVYPGRGDGTFQCQDNPPNPLRCTAINGSLTTGLSITGPMNAVDVNRDGRLDLVAQIEGGGVGTFLGNAVTAGLLTRVPSAVGTTALATQSTRTVAFDDLNRDGYLDVVGVTRGTPTPGGIQQNYFFSSRGTASGTMYTFGSDAHPLTGTMPGRLAIADFNKDGQKDAVVLDYDGSQAYVFLSRGDGTFADGPVLTVGNQPQFVVTGDWNDDNWIDIAVVDRNGADQSRTWVLEQVPGTGDATSPTVALVEPGAGSSLQGTVTVSATATDASGVARVEFYRGNILIGIDTTAPYSVSWDTTLSANGPYTLTARAYDTLDNPGSSTGVGVTVGNVDSTPPTVTLTWPTPAVTLLSGTVTLTANAADSGGVNRVEFWAGTTLVGSDATAPYAFIWNTIGFTPGTFDIVTKAYDVAGNVATSVAVTLIVDQPPAVVVTPIAPVEATSPAGAAVTLVATATDPDAGDTLAYRWEEGGTLLGSTPSISVTLSPGRHALLFRATDPHGIFAEDYLQVDILDSTPPTLTLPADIALEANTAFGAVVLFTATATDAIDPNPTITCTPPSGAVFGLGVTVVLCEASDLFNTTSGTFTVTVSDTTPPAVTAPSPIAIAATELAGARSNIPGWPASQALAAYLAGASALDIADPAPTRLAPQAIINSVAVDVTPDTLLPVGTTTVSFRFVDATGNGATATSTVTVAPPVGGIVGGPDQAVFVTNSLGVPQPLSASFAAVSQPGLLLAEAIPPPAAAPPGLMFASPVLDAVTSALVGPPITVCVQGTGFTPADRLLHYEIDVWLDVTTTASSNEVCGVVGAMSPFAVVTSVNHAPSVSAGPAQTIEATSAAGATVTLTGSATDPDPADVLTYEWTDGPVVLGSASSITLALPLGPHTLTLTVTDSRGATASASTTVLVQDTTAPAVIVPADQVLEAANASGAVGTFVVTATDIVDGTVAVSCSSASGGVFPLGTTNVTCTATDAAGHIGNGAFTVTVADTTGPALSLPAGITQQATSAAGNIVAFFASATDKVDGSVPVSCTPASGSRFPVAATVVTCSAGDTSGNVSSGSFTITIQDTVLPTVSISSPVNNARVFGIVTITAAGNDATGIAQIEFFAGAVSLGIDTTAPYSVGWDTSAIASGTTVNLRAIASDAYGNSRQASINVVVDQPDLISPVVTPPAPITVAATESGGARANVPGSAASQALAAFLTAGTAVDAVDPAPLRLSPQATINGSPVDMTTATLLPVGANTLTFRFRDAAGNIGTAQSAVTVTAPAGGVVIDPVVPVIATNSTNVPQPITVSFSTVNQPGLVTADPIAAPAPPPAGLAFSGPVYDIVTTALAGPPMTVCVEGPGFTASERLLHFENGAWVDVTGTVSSTSICGSVTSLSPFAVVTPADVTAPSLTLPANLLLEATSANGAVATFAVTAADDRDGDVPVTCAPASGSTFSLGTTTVSCSAADAAGNTATGTFTVSVQDTTAPTLTLPSDQTVEATTAAGSAVSFTASASDVVGGSVPVTCSPGSGTVFPIGATTVTCSATDTAANVATGSFTVSVQDTTAPTVSLTAPAPGTVSGVMVLEAAASDLVGLARVEFYLDGTTLIGSDALPAYSLFWNTLPLPNGAYTLVARAFDTAGNHADATIPVLVVNGPPVIVSSLTPSAPSPTSYGSPIVWTAVASGGIAPLQYRFWRFSAASGAWTMVRDYTPDPTYTWTPGASEVGAYYFQVWVRSATAAAAAYEAYRASGLHTITSGTPATLSGLAVSPASPVQDGTTVTWTASAAGGTGELQYEFWRYSSSAPVWTIVQPYGPTAAYTWTPAASDAGTHFIQVRVRSVGFNVPFESVLTGSAFVVTNAPPISITAVSVTPASPVQYGVPITWTATATGGIAPLEYEFWRYSYGSGAWTLARGYTADSSYTWTPTAADAGAHAFQVWVRSAGSQAPYEATRGTGVFTVTSNPPASLTSVTSSPALTAPQGTPVTWTAVATGGSGTLEYEFWRNCSSSPTWTMAQAYAPSASYTWTPGLSDVGECVIHVNVRSAGSPVPYESTLDSATFVVTSLTPIAVLSVMVTPASTVTPGTPVTWTTTATGGIAPLQYQFWRYSYTSGRWSLARDYSTDPSYTWTPSATDVGSYAFQVWVRSTGSTAAYEAYRGTSTLVVTSPTP